MRISSAPAAIPDSRARDPDSLPITSTIKILSWEAAVSLILSIASTTVSLAEAKPIE